MITQYALTANAWTPIGIAGQSGVCWLDEDGDGAGGAVDVRIITSATEPVLADATNGKRVWKPAGNNDFCQFAALDETYTTYAICKTAGSTAILSVDDCVGVMMVKAHPFNTEPDGALRAQIQDNSSELVGVKVCRMIGAVTLAADVTIDTYTAMLVPGHGATIGDIFCLKEAGRHYQATILNVVGDLITLDTPHEYSFTVDAIAFRSGDNMALSNGSVTPVIYRISPPPGAKWDIYGFSIGMTDGTAMDDGKFGGISALTRGMVVRKVDGVYKNVFNVKTNGDFAFRCDEVRYATNAPAGVYGISIKKTFSIRHGMVIRLDGDTQDELQFIIQDDLMGLTTCKAAAWGHKVT